MSNGKKLFLCFLTFSIIVQVNAQTEKMTSISLKASGMQYDKVRFHVRPGARVKITLKNEDDMSHNLVITQPGSRLDIVKAAQNLGEEGSKINFIPSLSKVLWYIPLLSPGQTESITFLAPKVPGIYPYVCTYPGHGFVMFGAMYVSNEAMPALKEDPNIPPSRKNDHDTTDHSAKALQAGHPYPLIPPFLFRTFMPDTGPDAIAVRLPQNLSYCWDAGTCRLRYAWQGEFLDFTDFWKSYKRFSVEITGTIFYRDKTKFPLHLGRSENIPVVEFKGYKLIEKYPEFHYTIKGIDVYELIHSKPDGTGLIRTFRIPEITESIWFTYGRGDGVNYYCSKGHVVNNEIKLSANEAHEFTIIMTKKGGF